MCSAVKYLGSSAVQSVVAVADVPYTWKYTLYRLCSVVPLSPVLVLLQTGTCEITSLWVPLVSCLALQDLIISKIS